MSFKLTIYLLHSDIVYLFIIKTIYSKRHLHSIFIAIWYFVSFLSSKISLINNFVFPSTKIRPWKDLGRKSSTKICIEWMRVISELLNCNNKKKNNREWQNCAKLSPNDNFVKFWLSRLNEPNFSIQQTCTYDMNTKNWHFKNRSVIIILCYCQKEIKRTLLM